MSPKKKNRDFFGKLQHKWKLDSVWQVVLVLLVFACTGLTILWIKQPIMDFLKVDMTEGGIWKTLLYLLLILPMYQFFLLVYGFIFGQFGFFWEKEKMLLKRMRKVFSTKSNGQEEV